MKKIVFICGVVGAMALSLCIDVFADDTAYDLYNIRDSVDYDLYEPVILQLEDAFSIGKDYYLSNLNNSVFEEAYPFANSYLLKQYYLSGENIGCTLFDINGDGQNELLIGSIWEDEYNDIRDIITFDGESYHSLFTDDWPGYLGHIDICKNGIVSSANRINENVWEYCFYRIATNGYELETVDKYNCDWETYPDTPYYNESGFYATNEVYEKYGLSGNNIDPKWYYLGERENNNNYYTDYTAYESIIGIWTATDNTDHWEFYEPDDYFKYTNGSQLEKRGKFLYYQVSNCSEYKGWFFVDENGAVYINYSGDDFATSSLLNWSFDGGVLSVDGTEHSRVADYIANGINGSYWDDGDEYYLFKSTGDMATGKNDGYSSPTKGEYYCWSDNSVLINKTSGMNNLLMEFDYYEDHIDVGNDTYWRQEYPYNTE